MNDLLDLVRELCRPRTAVVAAGNVELFSLIADELPGLTLIEVPSDRAHNGWVVPRDWRVEECLIIRDGTTVFDGSGRSLAVGYYSESFFGELTWEQLQEHLVTNPALPSATMFHCEWQYRPWAADWAISVPYETYAKLGPGTYEVRLRTTKEPGSMLIGVHDKPGASPKTIVFNSNNCHPHMANDGFAGTAVLIRVMQWLQSQDTFYSYRLVIAPEHLGSVFYLADLSAEELGDIVACVFEEMPGTQGPIKATRTFLGNTMLDQAVSNVLRHLGLAYAIVPWREGAGNDETVWEAPGYEVPCTEMTRCEDQFAPYAEYHSDLDSWELMDVYRLNEMIEAIKAVVQVLEENVTMNRTFDGLPCLSNPQYNLYLERPDPTVDKDLAVDSELWGHLLDSLLRYFDGAWTVLDVAEKHGLPFQPLREYIQRFADAGLVRLERAELPHVNASKAVV